MLLDTWAQSIPGLNELQLSAINDYGVLDEEAVNKRRPKTSLSISLVVLLGFFGAGITRLVNSVEQLAGHLTNLVLGHLGDRSHRSRADYCVCSRR